MALILLSLHTFQPFRLNQRRAPTAELEVNIEFLRDQLDKALIDVEKLKDKVRKNGNGDH